MRTHPETTVGPTSWVGPTASHPSQPREGSPTMVTAKPGKSPIPRPGENVDPKPLPGSEALLLDEVLDYFTEVRLSAEHLDSIAMQKAATLDRLYRSTIWVAEWLEIKPPKPNATGRPPIPSSVNRFNEWLTWRASDKGRTPPSGGRVYQLLRAHRVASLLHSGVEMTETAIRPLTRLITKGVEDQIPVVEQIALRIAAGGDVTRPITRQAMNEWNALNESRYNLGEHGWSEAERITRQSVRLFARLLEIDPHRAQLFIDGCHSLMDQEPLSESLAS